MFELPNGQPADGSIVGCRAGDGNAAVRCPPEVSFPCKSNRLSCAWEMSKAMKSIAFLDGPLLSLPVEAMLNALEATLCDAVDCYRDMYGTGRLQDETPQAYLDMESDLFFAKKLATVLESYCEDYPVSSKARFSSLGMPLLRELRTLLCFILDGTDPDATEETPAATNGRAPKDLAERPDPPAAPPSENRTAAAGGTPLAGSGRDFEAPAAAPENSMPRAPKPNLAVDDLALATWTRLSKENGRPPSVARVAREIGCNRQHLYDCPHFMALMNQAKADKRDRKKNFPRGVKDGFGRVEAHRDED